MSESRVAIIGAGVIGLSWAELFLESGWEVSIFDVSPDAVPKGRGFEVASSIEEAVRGADLVQENGPERLDIKRDLLGQIAAAASDDTIIASSTSSLLPSLLADGNERADQILVGHPYNPPQIMPLVEIVPGPTTRDELVKRAERIYRDIGKVPVALQREIPGFVGNRVQKAVLDEAMWLIKHGVVDARAFDIIFQESLGLRWASIGVLEASHLGGGPAGLRHIIEHVGKALDAIELHRPDMSEADRDALVQQVEDAYGVADTYASRAERRDRITRAVRGAVGAEQLRPVLYALDVLEGSVNRVDPHTGEVTQLHTGLTEAPDGLVVDTKAGHITFTCMGEPDGEAKAGQEPEFATVNGSVQRISLGGGSAQVIVPRGSFTTGKQITSDPATGRLFWSDREGRGIYRAEADGSGLTRLVDTRGTGETEVQEWCVGIAVDPEAGDLFWTQKGATGAAEGRILRASLELPEGETAATRTDIETLWSGLPEPIDLEIDAEARMLYWSDRGEGTDGNTLNRAPIPETGAKGWRPAILSRGFDEAIGLALDTVHHAAYVADLSGAIRQIDLGSGAERVVATLPGAATGLALAWE
ncbi:hypothetical protein JSO19_06240 [Leucobacter sp. UCMA 4100]|uniref:3-hydroxyacyl-CoA dehydrogenase NAD-binding domain-containing protein n=1 Tax=Leucobacter sp. UCMA 4100 TaxID=2810534 RepID=UPI0022EB9D5A|nr:3-hydroxyacyl-CoA dehydrogenase NAD-binding domain-containing protein [Leucobacter sp. UCMA 4100]MDA3146976.1 hypothetical protein [Leucobacter sp. UCMA 4100]